MIKRPRLAHAVLLCLSLTFVSCDKDDKTDKEDDETSDKDSKGSSDTDKESDGSSDTEKESDGSSDTEKESESAGESDSEGDSDTGDSTSGGDESTTEGEADPVATGRKFYDDNGCKSCHGANGEKKTGDNSLVDGKDTSDDDIKSAIKDGVPNTTMKAVKDVTDEEVDALLALIRCYQEKGADAADCGNE